MGEKPQKKEDLEFGYFLVGCFFKKRKSPKDKHLITVQIPCLKHEIAMTDNLLRAEKELAVFVDRGPRRTSSALLISSPWQNTKKEEYVKGLATKL